MQKKGKQRRKVQEPQPNQSPENSDDDTNHCFKCGGVYLDTEVREWVVGIPAIDGCISSVQVSKGCPRSQNNLCHICQSQQPKLKIMFSNNFYPMYNTDFNLSRRSLRSPF